MKTARSGPTPAAPPPPSFKPIHAGWTPDEIDRLREFEELPDESHAEEFKRSKTVVQDMWRKIKREDAVAAGTARPAVSHGRVPDRVERERERLAEARRQQTAAETFMGIPPTGYSALDRKMDQK